MDTLRFGVADYAAFSAMMLLSALVGVYFGFFKKQDTLDEYFLGGRSMSVFPIAMSLVASSISGVTMLGVPGDMYAFGSQLSVVALLAFPAIFIVIKLFLPTLYRLQFESAYEYLEHRFNRKIRNLTSFLFALGAMLYMPVVMYVPCLAMNQVSGINVHVISPIACLICIFYTCVGGLRAVVWTDSIQLISMMLASCILIVIGVGKAGGLAEVWSRNLQSGRVEFFNMDPSLMTRTSFWAVFLGEGANFLLHLGANPGSVQRYVSLPSERAARRSAWVLAFGNSLTRILTCATGFLMFAHYWDCDPLATGQVPSRDKLLPYYVMDVTGDIPGLPGLFIAGIFSAALSTMSAVLNTLAGTLYKDFLERLLPETITQKHPSAVLKTITLVLGASTVALVFVVEQLGSILEVAISLVGITGGASLGLFLMGLLMPWVEATGALCGALSSMVFMVTVYGGAVVASQRGVRFFTPLPTRVDGCNATTLTLIENAASEFVDIDSLLESPAPEDVFPLFRLSPFYYTVAGVVVTVMVGSVVSLVVRAMSSSCGEMKTLDPELFSPPVAKLLRRSERQRATVVAMQEKDQQYQAVPTASPPAHGERIQIGSSDDKWRPS